MTDAKKKAPSAANAEGHTDTTDGKDSRKPEPFKQASDALVIARLMKAGHHVHRCRDGGYTVSKFDLMRYCQDLSELQAFARQVLSNQWGGAA